MKKPALAHFYTILQWISRKNFRRRQLGNATIVFGKPLKEAKINAFL